MMRLDEDVDHVHSQACQLCASRESMSAWAQSLLPPNENQVGQAMIIVCCKVWRTIGKVYLGSKFGCSMDDFRCKCNLHVTSVYSNPFYVYFVPFYC